MRRRFLLTCCLCLLLVGMNSARAFKSELLPPAPQDDVDCWVQSVAFSPDGKVLASGYKNGTIELWDIKTGALVRTLGGGFARVSMIAFSPDGKVLAGGSSSDNTISLWDVKTGAVLRMLKDSLPTRVKLGEVRVDYDGHRREFRDRSLYRLAFSPDGKILASGYRAWDSDNEKSFYGVPMEEVFDTIKLWDVKSGGELATIRSHPVMSLAFSPDGQMLAARTLFAKAQINRNDLIESLEFWDVRTRTHPRTLNMMKFAINPEISPDWKVFASMARDENGIGTKLSDVKTGTALWASSRDAVRFAFSRDGKTLAGYDGFVMDSNGTVTAWEVASGKELRSFNIGNIRNLFNGYGIDVAFSTDLKLAVFAYNQIRLWDVNTGAELHALAPCSAARPSATPAPEVKTEKPAPSQTQPQVTQEAGKLRVTVETAILFDLDRSDLKPEAEAVLAQIKSSVIDQHPRARLLVEGHTDDTGSDAHNLELSSKRAQAVAAWLKGHGVDGSRMAIKGYGKANPKYPNTTDESRARNRRVEIVVVQ